MHTVLDDMPDRLRAAADDVASTTKAKELAIRLRNRLIVDACDGGMPQKVVARLVGVSQPHVIRVLARQDDDPVDAVAV